MSPGLNEFGSLDEPEPVAEPEQPPINKGGGSDDTLTALIEAVEADPEVRRRLAEMDRQLG